MRELCACLYKKNKDEDTCTFNPYSLMTCLALCKPFPGPEVIKLEDSLKLKIKHNDWLIADTSM